MAQLNFTEYDAFAQAVQDASVVMRNCSLEERRWTLQYATVGAMRLQRACEGGGTLAEGTTVNDGWVFFHQSRPVCANGQSATDNDIFVVPPGSEFCVTSKQAHEWLAIVIPSSLLFQSPAELESATGAKPRLLKPPSSVTRQFTSLLRRLLSEIEKSPELLAGTHAESCVQSEILQATKHLFNMGQESFSRHYGYWYGQTKAVLEAKLNNSSESMSIPDVARYLGVPERTLRSAFQKCYGLSPTECIRIYRLHQARQRLLTSDADQTTVTQVALDLGFWELGRFAGAYRKLFGERPSETLHRSLRAVQT